MAPLKVLAASPGPSLNPAGGDANVMSKAPLSFIDDPAYWRERAKKLARSRIR
jgi:hypothetical protein